MMVQVITIKASRERLPPEASFFIILKYSFAWTAIRLCGACGICSCCRLRSGASRRPGRSCCLKWLHRSSQTGEYRLSLVWYGYADIRLNAHFDRRRYFDSPTLYLCLQYIRTNDSASIDSYIALLYGIFKQCRNI